MLFPTQWQNWLIRFALETNHDCHSLIFLRFSFCHYFDEATNFPITCLTKFNFRIILLKIPSDLLMMQLHHVFTTGIFHPDRIFASRIQQPFSSKHTKYLINNILWKAAIVVNWSISSLKMI
jgi:hypothetical protein